MNNQRDSHELVTRHGLERCTQRLRDTYSIDPRMFADVRLRSLTPGAISK